MKFFFLWRLKNIIFRFVGINKRLPSDYLELGWCQGSLALDSKGNRIHSSSDDAVSWCFLGSVEAAFYPNETMIVFFRNTVRILMREGLWDDSYTPVGDWNDTPGRTQEEVVVFAKLVERKAGLR